MTRHVTILLTGVGAPGTPGTMACLRAGAGTAYLSVGGVDSDPESPGRYLVDRFASVPRPHEPGYLDAIIEAAHGVDAILPQTTAEVEFLSRTKHRIRIQRETGAKVVAAIGSAVAGANDKGAVMKAAGAPREMRMVEATCKATVGEVGNAEHELVQLGKAGRNRWKGRKPHNRGVSMNPIDHPLGGGEGRSSGGRHPVSPWGQKAKGLKTRTNKKTDKYIIRRRKK
jgi:hypothetical protein